MKEELSNLVHPVIAHALGVKQRLDRGETLHIDTEQSTLKGLLLPEVDAQRNADFGGDGFHEPRGAPDRDDEASARRARFLGVRYALACWLDELFVVYSPWSQDWNERKLEVSMYGSNDRAWRFWEQARLAEARPTMDALEVFFLCVLLGFRGELRERPEQLNAWVVARQAQLTRVGEDWPHPPELDPPTHVPPLRGRERFARVVYVGALALLVLLPVVVFSLVQRLGQ
ncbi:MAG TPA: DotU family type IV/VI secretion system protein [Gemmataceae bacterium]|nr:DotU family type IV/VI secretion system protein [Gemmataceae bacterium]